MSSSRPLQWATRSSSASAATTNGVVSTESVPDNDTGEHDTSFDSSTVGVMPVLAAAAAGDGTLDAAEAVDCTAEVVTALSTTPATMTSTLLWASVIPTKLCPENDDCKHGTSLTVMLMSNSESVVPVMLSTASTTEVPVCISWESTKPWLEPVPLHPLDSCSLPVGSWSGSGPEASMIVQSAVKCNDTEEVPVCVLSNEVPQQDEVQQQPWPPPELEVLCSNDVHSRQLTNAGFEVPPCPVRPMNVLATSSVLELLRSANAPGFLRRYLVQKGTWRAPYLCEVILGAIASGSDYFRWEIAWVIVVSSCAAHTDLGGSGNLTMSGTSSLFMDHHSRLEFVILGVPVTWPHFSMAQITESTSKVISCQPYSMSSVDRLLLWRLVQLMYVPSRPLDALDYTGGVFSSRQPILLAPIQMPPWLLHRHKPSTSHAKYIAEWLTSLWDPRQYSVIVSMHTYTTSDNAEVHRRMKLMDIPPHWQFLRKEEYARSEKYASSNLTIEGKRVLITWSLTSLYGCNTAAVQSSKETMCSELVCYPLVLLDMQLLLWFDIEIFSGTCDAPKVQSSRKFTSSNQLQELTYVKGEHLNYPVVKRNITNASPRGGEDNGLAHGSHIWSVAWILDGLEFSIACQHGHIQGGTNVIPAIYCKITFSPGTYFGVEWLNGILLQDYLLFQFIGHVIQCGFELLQWKIAWLLQLQCSEITSADLKRNMLPDVDEEIIEANLMVVSYWATSVGAWLVWSRKLMKLVRGSEQDSNSSVSSPVQLSVWQHVNYTQWSCDPGGSVFAVCRSQQWWPNPERLHCPEELEWSFVLSARAFWIWLVAWDVDDLEFSADGGQATFQGWTIAIRVTFSDHIQTSQDFYIAFVNQIPVSYNYSDQAYCSDTFCSNIVSYREDYHGDSSTTKVVHMSWDPGISSLKHTTLKFRLGDKPNFKEGGMLGPSLYTSLIGLCHGLARRDLAQPIASFRSTVTNIQQETMRKVSKLDQAKRRRLLPPTSALPSHPHSCCSSCIK